MRYVIVILFWVWPLLGVALPAHAAPYLNLEFEHNSCTTLYDNLREQGAITDGSIDCGDVAAALTGTTGKYPFWLGCLGYGDMPATAHLARCVMLSAEVQTDAPPLNKLEACEQIIGFYETNLRASQIGDQLPPGYTRPTCAQAEEARLVWTGNRPAWLRCRGYDRANEEAHAATCLLGESRLDRLDSCKKVRSLYEERLIAAYGQKPEGYRPIRCSNVEEIVNQATATLEKLRSEQRSAQLRAASQRVRLRRPTPQINMEQLIKGFLLLKLQAETALAGVTLPDGAEIAAAASGINARVRDGLPVLKDREELSSASQNFFRRDLEVSAVDVETGQQPQHQLLMPGR
ncbi:hypothetical protein [Rhodovulum marinum]|uniref:YARHG domain-containing protein n=1 Tax=Rhodovulum marinum TaxID=320662 RepID=A0A4V2SQ93_9RHOB|nr:hypothetical protein [Rhodovulum marinum]TCP38076.1 hypothetical protein EV662_12220 [Rhodovulum marinum]